MQLSGVYPYLETKKNTINPRVIRIRVITYYPYLKQEEICLHVPCDALVASVLLRCLI